MQENLSFGIKSAKEKVRHMTLTSAIILAIDFLLSSADMILVVMYPSSSGMGRLLSIAVVSWGKVAAYEIEGLCT